MWMVSDFPECIPDCAEACPEVVFFAGEAKKATQDILPYRRKSCVACMGR